MSDRPPKRWSHLRLIDELRKLAASGTSVRRAVLRRSEPALVRAAERYFGSYRQAAEAAGIPAEALARPAFRRWTPDAVVAELKRLRRGRRKISPEHVQKTSPAFYEACRKRFGSYRAAVEAAGISYRSIARPLSKPMMSHVVIARLKSLHERGRDLRFTAINKSDPRLVTAARRRFGSYGAAVIAAGLDYPPKRRLRHWTEPLVLAALRELAGADVDLRHSAMKSSHRPLFEAAKHYFGSYVNAVREAGLDYAMLVKRRLPSARLIKR